jgi:hypothetical protein
MKEDQEQMCPLFPDMKCPRGKEAAEECEVRINGIYDPVADFKDFLVMHCALHRSLPGSENMLNADKNLES